MSNQNLEQSLYPISKNGNDHLNGNGNYLYSMPVISPSTIDEDEESIDLRQLLNVAKHRLRLIALVTLGVTTAAALWTFTQEPKYRGSFQILVEPLTQEKAENPLSLINGDWSGLDYETQIEVLQSPRVLTPIVEKLAVRYPDIEYKSLIKGGKSPLEIEQLQSTKILEVSYTDTDPEQIQFVIDNLAQSYLAYSLEERRAGINQSIEFVKQQLPSVTSKVDDLQEELQIFRQRYNLLDPEEQATLLANRQTTFEDKYFNTQVQLNETKTLFTILQAQLGKQPQQAIATSYLGESPRYQKLLNELQAIELKLANESVRFGAENPTIVTLEARKSQVLGLLEQEATRLLGPRLGSGIDYSASYSSSNSSSIRSKLNSQYIEAANKIKILEIRESALASAIDTLNQNTEQMPVIIRKYTDLQRQLTIATTSLNRFLEAQETLELQASQQALPWQTISEPKVTEKPVSPNIPRNLALGLIGGLFMGIGAALLAERLDPVFHSSEEIKEALNLPILGLIPTQKDLKPNQIKGSNDKNNLNLPQLQIGNTALELTTSSSSSTTKSQNPKHRYNASPFLESFRSLNTNIRLLGSDNRLNSIVISSSIPSEGKSTIAFHLAQASAAMGQRVLLIDADLRRPQVHYWTGLKNDKGLSNALAMGLDIEEVIQKVPQWENLSVITAGDIPPDPTRLLSSQKMQELMDGLLQSQQYDLIIYDTPPILGFGDGRILSLRTNGVVLVVRMGKTDRALLKQNIDNLKIYNVPLLGLVANQANRNADGGYHYYSRYYADRA